MNNNTLLKFSDIIKKRQSLLAFAEYDWYKLNENLPIEWFAYDQFLSEHARELANTINDLRRYIVSLSAWKEVLENTSGEQEKYNVVTEYVSPIATLALNMPYIIRSRFIYSVAHLSHQANKIKQDSWIDDFPIDSEIYFEQADKYAKPWKRYTKFKQALEKIANKKYNESTHDFRNKYHHRYSPHIEYGLTGFVTRNVSTEGGVSYGFGETEPLKLKDIIPVLENQYSQCMSAFKKYQDIVNDQILGINQTLQPN